MVQLVLLCAGAGTRLKHLTKNTPKPMILFNNRPFLDYVLSYYKKAGINNVIIAVGYLADKIKDYFKDGKKFGLSIQYAQSSVEVETGGSFKRSLPYIKDDYFFVQWGDIFFPLDYNLLLKKFIDSGKKAMIVACKREQIKEYEDKNDLQIKGNNVIKYDRGNSSGKCNMLNGGIMIFRKDVLKFELPDKFRLEEGLFPKLIATQDLIAYVTKKIPYDIGNIDKMKRFQDYLEG